MASLRAPFIVQPLLGLCLLLPAHASFASYVFQKPVHSLQVVPATTLAPVPTPDPEPAPPPSVTVSTSALDFGEVPLGSSTSLSVLLSNSGQSELSIGEVGLTGSLSFTASSSCSPILAQGQSCGVSVTYSPGADTQENASLSMATGAGAQTVALTGKGLRSITATNGVRHFSDGTYAQSCLAYLTSGSYVGSTGDGLYRIQPVGQSPIDAHCDMTQDGGGWTRIGVFNGTSDTTLPLAQRKAILYTQAKFSANGTSTFKLIDCHATPKAGFAADNSAGVNCTKADSDGYTYSVRVLQVGANTGGNYGLYTGGSLNASGGCNWATYSTKVWGRHFGGGTFCQTYGTGQTYSSSTAWGTTMGWLLVR